MLHINPIIAFLPEEFTFANEDEKWMWFKLAGLVIRTV